MAPTMVTAARLLGHKSVNGEYLSTLQLDEMDALGLQRTHSIDSFITSVQCLVGKTVWLTSYLHT